MARIFVYDGREFPDPDVKLPVEEVRKQLTDFFPELANAETREEQRGDDTLYTFSRRIGTDVCGPSNIGNFLAAQGVPTICAPGVGFGNIHAANEWADVASIASVYSMYCDAVRRFLVAC